MIFMRKLVALGFVGLGWVSGWGQPNVPVPVGPPVVLVNGFQFPDNILELATQAKCSPSKTEPKSKGTFGEMEALLSASGYEVRFFDNCAECPGGSIEECGQALGRYLQALPSEKGPGTAQVDVVAHSMGGLIARAYLAGMKAGGGFAPPALPQIRKLVMLGTPNQGSYLLGALTIPVIGQQLPELAPGSGFLYELGKWRGGRDDLPGVDAMAIVGNGCAYGPFMNAGDGVVTVVSGAINFAREPWRTRVIPYQHTSHALVLCPKVPTLAGVDSASHLSFQAITSFLTDSGEWLSIGQGADEDYWLQRYGSGMVSMAQSTRLVSGYGGEWKKRGEVYYNEWLPAEATDLWFEVGGLWVRLDAVIPAGAPLVGGYAKP